MFFRNTIFLSDGKKNCQGKLRSVYNFILRDINVKNLDSYVMKNTRIDCDKDTYNVLKESIVKPLNDEIKIIMNEDYFFKCEMKIKNLLSNIPKVRI